MKYHSCKWEVLVVFFFLKEARERGKSRGDKYLQTLG